MKKKTLLQNFQNKTEWCLIDKYCPSWEQYTFVKENSSPKAKRRKTTPNCAKVSTWYQIKLKLVSIDSWLQDQIIAHKSKNIISTNLTGLSSHSRLVNMKIGYLHLVSFQTVLHIGEVLKHVHHVHASHLGHIISNFLFSSLLSSR